MTTILDQQLRAFHMTGMGLEEQRLTLPAALLTTGCTFTAEDAFYPIRLSADFAVNPHATQWSIPFHADAATTLPAAALLRVRGSQRQRCIEQLRQVAERLGDLLALDDSHAGDGATSSSIVSALGKGASRYLNVDALASALNRRVSPVQRMDATRRERCREALAGLRSALAATAAEAPLHLFFQGEAPANPFGCKVHAVEDPCKAGLAFLRERLREAEPWLRAMRVARLELESAYEPDRHDAVLARFRWEAADPAELFIVPAVLVVLTQTSVLQLPLESLSALMRSGCPIQVVITRPCLSEDDIRAETTDVAAFAVAQRRAIVVQSSLAHPNHLLPALDMMAASTRPGVAVVATPAAGGWLEAVLLPEVKDWPLYRYDPDAGSTFSARFNLQPVEPGTCTIAQVAALNPDLAHHFRLLPESEDLHETVDLSRYLEPCDAPVPFSVPYFELQPASGAAIRVAISRDLADYCRDRIDAWNMLQQWVATKIAAPVNAPDSHSAAKREGAELAIARVLSMLTNGPRPEVNT